MTSKPDRIANLFLRGYSVDLISELGIQEGWTRRDVKMVVTARCWALDFSGRLQPTYLKKDQLAVQVCVLEAQMEEVLNVALDHESPIIRDKARVVQEAMDDLRVALLHEEEQEAVRAVRRARVSEDRGQDQQAPGYLRTIKSPASPQRGTEGAGEVVVVG